MQQEATIFLTSLLAEAKRQGLDLENAEIDHLCYRTESPEDYQRTKNEFTNFSEMIAETNVNGRPIAAFKLNPPWQLNQYAIDFIEVPHPKKNKPTKRGFEHLEVVIKISFDEFRKQHPQFTYVESGLSKELNPELEIEFKSGAIKFHHMRLEKVIEIEQS